MSHSILILPPLELSRIFVLCFVLSFGFCIGRCLCVAMPFYFFILMTTKVSIVGESVVPKTTKVIVILVELVRGVKF